MPSSTPPPVPPQPQSLHPLPSPVAGLGTRINLWEIRSKISKRIGPERTKKYFGHLQRFLSLKLSKTVFHKLCLTVLGNENLRLHNHLIRSILHNACRASGPPTVNAPKSISVAKNSTHLLISPVSVYDNGDVPHQHVKDHHPPIGKTDAFKPQPSLVYDEDVVRENGVPHLTDLKRLSELQDSDLVEPLAKRLRVENTSFNVFDSPHSNGPVGVVDREILEDIAQHVRYPVTAPLGTPFCSGHFGGSWKPLMLTSSTGSDNSIGYYELGQLCDSSSLRKRIEKIAETEGLDGVSIECSNLLNNAIDIFLKQLIGSCVELVRARAQNDRLKLMAVQQQLSQKLINGVRLQNQVHGQNGGTSTTRQISSVSLQDLKAVSEINPQLLGVNASLLLEKINSYD